MEPKIIIAVIAISMSTIISCISLYLNYLSQRKANRLTSAGRLALLSKILVDEYNLRISHIRDLERLSPTKTKKDIEELMKENEVLNLEHDDVTKKFRNLDKLDPVDIEERIKKAYTEKGKIEIRIKEYEKDLKLLDERK